MGSITSGVGLVSGINTGQLIDQLLSVEARPRTRVQRQVSVLQSKKTAFNDINARLLALKGAADSIGGKELFGARKATSSAPDILTATADEGAAEGTYHLSVSQLVNTHQIVSRGFGDSDTTAVGEATLSFNSHRARLDGDAALADLNGGTGVQRGRIRVRDRSGASAEIDLTRAATLDDVLEKINNASGIRVHASLDGDGLKLTDATAAGSGGVSVEEVGSTRTAADLGILGDSGGAASLTGDRVNRLSALTQLQSLNDGLGVRIAGGGRTDLRIEAGGTGFDVSLDGASTVGDVIDAINDHADNAGSITASVGAEGVGLRLEASGGGAVSALALNGSRAANDLGILGSGDGAIEGDRVLAALGSKLLKNLNGGAGVGVGSIDVVNRAGTSTRIDLSGARSVSDVIDGINEAGAGVAASLNDAGNGVELTDTTGSTANNLSVSDASGTLAADLGLNVAGGVAADTLDGGDRNLQYLSENTRLETLNGGTGIARGKFTLTDSSGASATVDLTQESDTTIGGVIAEINSRSTSITAAVNDSGDGILLTDTAGGALGMKVAEEGSSTAADLGLLGEAEGPGGTIDGSFERTVSVAAGDTLEDVARKINEAGVAARASIFNEGAGAAPYRLNIASTNSGADGRILFDDGGLDLGARDLVRGEDAVALLGSADPSQALLVTSSSNTLDDTIPGLNIDLLNTSDRAVRLSVGRDNEAVGKAVAGFAKSFNDAIDTLDKYDKYDAETEERGLLLGDSTVARVRRDLYRAVNTKVEGVGGRYQYLAQVGVTVGNGARIQVDREKFDEALAADPEAVKDLFTATSVIEFEQPDDLPDGVTIPDDGRTRRAIGFGARLEDLLTNLTRSTGGTITRETNRIDQQVEFANDRIDRINDLLASKRQRLESQFSQMESALARMQSQQNALAGLSQAAANFGGSGLGL